MISLRLRTCLASFVGAALLSSLFAAPAAAQNPPRRVARGGEAPLKAGDEAPSFTLTSLDGKQEFELDAARAERPVILIFGSYT